MTHLQKIELEALELLEDVENAPKYLITTLDKDGTYRVHGRLKPPLKAIMTRSEIEAIPGVEKWVCRVPGPPRDFDIEAIEADEN